MVKKCLLTKKNTNIKCQSTIFRSIKCGSHTAAKNGGDEVGDTNEEKLARKKLYLCLMSKA